MDRVCATGKNLIWLWHSCSISIFLPWTTSHCKMDFKWQHQRDRIWKRQCPMRED
jgi:hypothetical protein